MEYYVIDKKYLNQIYTKKPNIEYLKFKTIEEANNYIKEINNYIEEIVVFTDGSCKNNGKKNARAGIGVYFSENDPRNVSRKIIGKQTNNTAELTAVIEVFKILDTENQKIIIYTDSEYVIKCCGNYGKKCEDKSWKNSKGFIPNYELVREIYTLFKRYQNVSIKYVKAHTGKNDFLSKGNDGADKLANLAL